MISRRLRAVTARGGHRIVMFWRQVQYRTGLRRATLYWPRQRPNAPYRAIVLGLDRSQWMDFDAAFPEYEKAFAGPDTQPAEIQTQLGDPRIALIRFEEVSPQQLAMATARRRCPIFRGAIAPVPYLQREGRNAKGFLIDTLGSQESELEAYHRWLDITSHPDLVLAAKDFLARSTMPPLGRHLLHVTGHDHFSQSYADGDADNAQIFPVSFQQKTPDSDQVRDFVARLEGVAKVQVQDHDLGLLALLLGRQVMVTGHPFWSGLGLTEDSDQRKLKRSLDLAELTAIVIFLLPRYVDSDRGMIDPADGWHLPTAESGRGQGDAHRPAGPAFAVDVAKDDDMVGGRWSGTGMLSSQPRNAHEISLRFWMARRWRDSEPSHGSAEIVIDLVTALRPGIAARDLQRDDWADRRFGRVADSQKLRFERLSATDVLRPAIWPPQSWQRLGRWLQRRRNDSMVFATALWKEMRAQDPRLSHLPEDLPPAVPRILTPLLLTDPERATISSIAWMTSIIRAENLDRLAAYIVRLQSVPLSHVAREVIGRAAASGMVADKTRLTIEFQIACNLLLLAITDKAQGRTAVLAAEYMQILGLGIIELTPITNGGEANNRPVDRWIIANPAPATPMIGALSAATAQMIDLTAGPISDNMLGGLARSGQSLTTQLVTDLRVQPYSKPEEALSAASARLAAILVGELSALAPEGPSLSWLGALELSIDDLIFGKAIDFWSVLQDLGRERTDVTGLATLSPDWARAFVAGIAGMSREHSVSITAVTRPLGSAEVTAGRGQLDALINGGFPATAAIGAETAVGQLFRKLGDLSQNHNRHAPKASDTAEIVLVGRSFDRNYHIDLAEIGRALRPRSRVTFMPTAGLRGKHSVTALRGLISGDWHDRTMIAPLLTLTSPLVLEDLPLSGLYDLLIRNAHRRGRLDFTTGALAFAVRPTIDAFLNRRLRQYLQAGMRLAGELARNTPDAIVLLPGRDYLAQVAAIEGRRLGVVSYDVQTVFVGPRSRYKLTRADYQLAIETHSQHIFEDFFGLDPQRILLSGCAKVGVVQQKARGLDPVELRRKASLTKAPLIFAGSPFLAPDRPILEALVEEVAKWPDMQLAIRMHPTAHDDYREFCAGLTANQAQIMIETRLDLAETLAIAGILVTRFSNVGLEAALLGRDVIACDFIGEYIPIRLDQMGVAAIARSPEELRALIADFMARGPQWHSLGHSRAEYVRRNPQLAEESPGGHIADLIMAGVAAQKSKSS